MIKDYAKARNRAANALEDAATRLGELEELMESRHMYPITREYIKSYSNMCICMLMSIDSLPWGGGDTNVN